MAIPHHHHTLWSLKSSLDAPGLGVRIPRTRGHWGQRVAPYLTLLRVDHWSKNAFMVLGFVLALFYRPEVLELASLPQMLWARRRDVFGGLEQLRAQRVARRGA